MLEQAGIDSRQLRLANTIPFRPIKYSENAKWGVVLNAAYRLNPNHKLVYRNTLTHDTEKTAREFRGYDGGVDGIISSQRLRFIERNLFATHSLDEAQLKHEKKLK